MSENFMQVDDTDRRILICNLNPGLGSKCLNLANDPVWQFKIHRDPLSL